ncbi:DUF11 domain-containing protein [Microbacterium sp. 4R-513]|uniref:DUF7507 domain-containing protein n=1 Tax=Microbacterium sp. 4R-513 TaxID=2567934 RepID=UPI0013E16E7A|nr:DUF11 domain-containing protein [Microbacterium sp. 4R-513]QIG38942.1 DUF11 domain-containing protein [Microbacterium sp. 4R-513]
MTDRSSTTPATTTTRQRGAASSRPPSQAPRLDGANVFETTNASRQLEVYFQGRIPTNAARNTYTTNTFNGTLDYEVSGLGAQSGSGTSTIHLIGLPPTITASTTTPTIAGGASSATPTTDVTFSVCGTTTNVAADHVPFTPEYVFMAPVGWTITPGSASFPAGSVPDGVSFVYRTAVVGGVARQVAVAAWPAGITFGMNQTLPCMRVIARPDATVAAGTSGQWRAFVGNTGDVQTADIFTLEFTDTPDIDGNPATLRFSEAAPLAAVPVAAVAALQVLKEICLPDASQPDGCQWFADPDNYVGVPPNSDSIRYRLTVTNIGNSTLSDVVGYDILPYPGDTGTSDATGGIARGSTFRETVESVTGPTNGATATYSGATQPCRPEVDATVQNCVDDWSPTPSGAQAIRLAKPGPLPAGQSFSMQYTAAVEGAPGFGAVACNSFAVRVTGLSLVSEPAPVCASIEETDLQIVAGTPRVQQGRPGVLPWTVTNNGGAASTIGTVALGDIPAGLVVTSLTPAGWTCTATDADGNPVFGTAVGPATLSCTSNGPLLLGVPVPLDIPVIATTLAPMTIPAIVSGRMFDTVPENNDAEMQVVPTPPAGGIGVAKDDGVTTASPGDVLTYTITIDNPLDFETITGATLTDELPAGVEFVSASDGGVETDGTVVWSLPDLPGGADQTVILSVRVLPTIATSEIANTAQVSAPDPAITDATLTGEDDDVDAVVTAPALTLTKTSAEDTFAAVGDTVEYRFTASNTGDVTLTGVTIDDPLPGLSALVYTWPGAPGVLQPGEDVEAVATYSITQDDLDQGHVDNSATAEGTPPAGAAVGDDATWTVTSSAVPHLTVTKEAAPTTVVAAGASVVYTIRVLNDGPVTVEDVTITDPLPGLPALQITWPGDEGVLASGQEAVATATYTTTVQDADAGRIVNTATAAGRTPGGVDVSDDGSATVLIPSAPAIEVVKQVDYEPGTAGRAGDTLLYGFTVRNTGNVTLTDVEVTDPLPGLSEIAYGTWPGTPGVLAPGQFVTATATYVVTQDDVDGLAGVSNTATATGTPPTGPDVSDDDTATITTPATSGLQLVKTPTLTPQGDTVAAGDVVEYEFQVTNTGDVTLHDVVLVDPMPGLSALELTWPGAEGILAPLQVLTATATYELTQADIDRGSLTNTARTAGLGPDEVETSDSATAAVVLPPAPVLTLEKTAVLDPAADPTEVGDVIEYSFSATNDGNVTLSGVLIADPLPGLSPLVYSWPGVEGTLAPGDVVTATATYAVTQADIDAGQRPNLATATGRTPGEESVTGSDSALVLLFQQPGIALRKTATAADARWAAGDVVTFSFAVTNTGNVTQTGVEIADPMPGLSQIAYTWPGQPGVLAPGEAATATATYALTGADVARGTLDNTATVTTDRGTEASDSVRISSTPSPTPPLPVTGGALAAWLPPLGAGLAALGLALLVVRRRRNRSTT